MDNHGYLGSCIDYLDEKALQYLEPFSLFSTRAKDINCKVHTSAYIVTQVRYLVPHSKVPVPSKKKSEVKLNVYLSLPSLYNSPVLIVLVLRSV